LLERSDDPLTCEIGRTNLVWCVGHNRSLLRMPEPAPQIAGRDEPFRSPIREHLKGHTQGLEDLAIERNGAWRASWTTSQPALSTYTSP
jgi:hypothetical protein